MKALALWSFVTFTYLCPSEEQKTWKCPVKNRDTNNRHPSAEHWPGSPPCWSSLQLCFWKVWRYTLLDLAAFPVLQILPCVWQSLLCRSLQTHIAVIWRSQLQERKESKEQVSARHREVLFIAAIFGGLVTIKAFWTSHCTSTEQWDGPALASWPSRVPV